MNDGTMPGPEIIAAKFAAVAAQTNPALAAQFKRAPRLAEALWYLEWRRRQAGGLAAFASDLVRFAGDALMPQDFLQLEVDKQGRFSPDSAFAVWSKLPKWAKPAAPPSLARMLETADASEVATETDAIESGIGRPDVQAFQRWLTRDVCLSSCAAKTPERLAEAIVSFFSCDNQAFPESISGARGWHKLGRAGYRLLPNLPELLVRYLEVHAGIERGKVADTEATALVFEALEYAQVTKSLALITGHARYGKTESMLAWCNAYPGRARLVRTPSLGGEKLLLLRIADALGFNLGEDIPLSRLRERVCFVLRHGAPMLSFDESQFLLPASYTRTTAPVRLNFIRTEIVDAGMACVLTATPQAHQDSLDKFVRKTRYALEQWLGRVDQVYRLPENFSIAEMLKVARLRLPGISEKSAALIVARAKQSDLFLHAIKSIGKRACWLAGRAGRAEPTPEEINRASDEFMNGVGSEIDRFAPAENAVQVRRSGPAQADAKPVPTIHSRTDSPAGREMTPAVDRQRFEPLPVGEFTQPK